MDGILLIDKPAGLTSAEVVRRIKARVKPARVGHLGTLDPFATGLLPILVGEATKLASFLEDGGKQYQGVIALGTETDTLDPTGATIREAPVPALDDHALVAVARRFSGEIEQVPPVFSAIKRQGVPLYKLARRGLEVEPAPVRRVTIESLELSLLEPTRIGFRVVCSGGTYIRALARDIGQALGTVAHLLELRRTRSSGFSIDDAHALEQTLERLVSGEPQGRIGLRQALSGMLEVEVDQPTERRLRNGESGALLGLVRNGVGYFKIVRAAELVALAQASVGAPPALVRVFQPGTA